LEEKMNALEGRFLEVENRVVRSEGIVQDNTKRVDEVEKRQDRVEQALEQEREKMRKERAEEMRERDIRKKNVIMHRVGEAADTVKTAEERRAWDMRSCDNIFRALNLDMTSETAVKFCRRVGEKGEGPRPLIVGMRREWQKEDLLDSAKNLKNTQFADIVVIPDLTKEQRKEEAEMISEAEERNRNLTQEDRAKNLEWMVVGARGERRIVKGVARVRGGGPPPARARGGLAPPLLPPRMRQGPWNPVVGGRGAGGNAGQRGRPSQRGTSAKRRRGGTVEGEEEDEDEEMENERQPPLPPQPGN
jgi:hypothetical protein